MSLDSLPPELYHNIISHFDPEHLRPSVLALSRAIPYSPVPVQALYRQINVYSTDVALRLYRRLRHVSDSDGKAIITHDPIALSVKELYVECWDIDADVLVNLISLLKALRVLSLKIGPLNFAPEHLEEVVLNLRRDMVHLECLECRFRPYVEKATYLPFLKGSYFDSTLIALSEWSHTALQRISIIQDPLDPSFVRIPEGSSFAQPIVFFRLDQPLSVMLACPRITSVAFRLPTRRLSRAFTHETKNTFAQMRTLDLSTASIYEADIENILTRFSQLENLFLDGCRTLASSLGNASHGEQQQNWYDLGKICALGGSRRAREYERMINKWIAEAISVLHAEDPDYVAKTKTKVKKGRRGLATATISIKAPEQASSSGSTSSRAREMIHSDDPLPEKIRILPPVPTLKTLCISIRNPHTTDILSAFDAGWEAGLDTLANQRKLILTTFRNMLPHVVKPTRVVKFDEAAETWESLKGYVDVTMVDVWEEDTFRDGACDVPVLCLAGEGVEGEHAVGCGHAKSLGTRG